MGLPAVGATAAVGGVVVATWLAGVAGGVGAGATWPVGGTETGGVVSIAGSASDLFGVVGVVNVLSGA